ncbi:MAG: hypothetical protein QN720_05950, partial [Nitrososphaeraceae archaeon]|nr:hypothetical protein [Nitrososphaeraceae archaeon]MDW0332490.1 hypothetical protein [Nitrososphaeraceae archaeon]
CLATPWLTERHGYDPTYYARILSLYQSQDQLYLSPRENIRSESSAPKNSNYKVRLLKFRWLKLTILLMT